MPVKIHIPETPKIYRSPFKEFMRQTALLFIVLSIFFGLIPFAIMVFMPWLFSLPINYLLLCLFGLLALCLGGYLYMGYTNHDFLLYPKNRYLVIKNHYFPFHKETLIKLAEIKHIEFIHPQNRLAIHQHHTNPQTYRCHVLSTSYDDYEMEAIIYGDGHFEQLYEGLKKLGVKVEFPDYEAYLLNPHD